MKNKYNTHCVQFDFSEIVFVGSRKACERFVQRQEDGQKYSIDELEPYDNDLDIDDREEFDAWKHEAGY